MNPGFDLDRLFDYHAPDNVTRVTHEGLRYDVKTFAAQILQYLPDGREKALFMTNLEQASFWAHAAIARSQA